MKSSGELLIFALMIVTNGRVFFVKSRKDAIVVLSPLAFILSIFQICSWGFDPFTFTAFVMSLLVMLSNFHALYRYFEHLYVDHYSTLMEVWAVGTCIICTICFLFILFFMPVQQDLKKLNVNLGFQRYTGSFRSGFVHADLFDSTNLVIHEFSKGEKTNIADNAEISADNPPAAADISANASVSQASAVSAASSAASSGTAAKPVILFFPDKRGDTYAYVPYLAYLAAQGYTVYSADFYSKDCRWLHNSLDGKIFRRFGMIISSLSKAQFFNSQKEFYTYNCSLECSELVKMISSQLDSNSNTKFILISDVMANSAIEDYAKNHPEQIAGTFKLDSLQDYKTSGYGFVCQTDPLLGRILGQPSDKMGFYTRLAALKTRDAIKTMYIQSDAAAQTAAPQNSSQE